MATDWYPTQEGRIADGLTINCIVGATAVAELDIVKHGVSASGQITVIPATAIADGWGVALRAGAVGDPVPVLVYGLVKLVNGTVAAVEQGQVVINSANSYIQSCEDSPLVEADLMPCGGLSIVLGMLMQTTTAISDEVLVLVGKCI